MRGEGESVTIIAINIPNFSFIDSAASFDNLNVEAQTKSCILQTSCFLQYRTEHLNMSVEIILTDLTGLM